MTTLYPGIFPGPKKYSEIIIPVEVNTGIQVPEKRIHKGPVQCATRFRSTLHNMQKRILGVIVCGMVLLSSVSGQSLNERIYHAYIAGKMDDWFHVMSEMKSIWEITGSDEMLYDLIVAEYGYIAYSIGNGHDKEARKFLRQVEDHLDIYLDKYPENARAHALQGAIYGFKVGLDPYKAVVFGHRSFSENKLAQELDPDDPQVLMEKGNIEFYKPDIFNPSSEEAARIYREALKQYENTPGGVDHNWLYLNTLRSLAKAYIASGAYQQADETYRKMLQVEPELSWIRDKHYPAFRKKYLVR